MHGNTAFVHHATGDVDREEAHARQVQGDVHPFVLFLRRREDALSRVGQGQVGDREIADGGDEDVAFRVHLQ